MDKQVGSDRAVSKSEKMTTGNLEVRVQTNKKQATITEEDEQSDDWNLKKSATYLDI